MGPAKTALRAREKLTEVTLKLHDYQRDMANFLIGRLTGPGEVKGGGLFADLGVGKTAATLTALDHLVRNGHTKCCLVIGPLRPIQNTWPKECKLWAPKLTHQSLHGYRYPYDRLPRRHLEFQSMDSLHKLLDHSRRWDTVVVDESHGFKGWTTKRTRALRYLLKDIRKRIILTGTPNLTALQDLHPQAFILDNGEALGKNITVFRSLYMRKGGWQGRQWEMKDGVRQTILEAISHLVMRVDADSHLDMPELIENDIVVSMPSSIRSDYNTLKRKLYLELENDKLLVGNAAALYAKLKQYACGQVYVPTGEVRITKSGKKVPLRRSEIVNDAKLSALGECIDNLCGKPAIVLYQFTHDRERIVDALKKKKRKVRVLAAGASQSEANNLFDDWNARRFDDLVSYPRCLSEGLNLQSGGADAIWFGLPDRPVDYIQTRGRIYRQGQKEHVRMHRLIMEDTVETLQRDRLDGRIRDQDEFLDALKTFAKGGK